MKNYTLILIALVTLGTVSCKNDKKGNDSEMNATEMDSTSMDEEAMSSDMESEEMTVMMESKSDSNAKGTVTFEQDDDEITMTADFTGLEPGTHAIHLHENADCSAADGTSAGGHWNPTNEKHGKWGDAEGYHKGDIGNFEADADGNGSVTFTTDEWCVGCEDPNMNIIGKGIIVHQGGDDFTSQPSGDAGARVSCGGIIQ
ncbi:superoxide dismutase family protein [Flavimarina sp. Hel_I_48]|uniref:superoxide dismutase family protein n=1 Tax=Flavimarina sp. Hel_I_48 TaxID=1392488 RepID=UPI0004DF343E|nr:superoxide dismutase family protein [Flavimarina sp. Hel_I_48]